MKINASQIEYSHFEERNGSKNYPTSIIIPFTDLKEDELQMYLDSLKWNTTRDLSKMDTKEYEHVTEYTFTSLSFSMPRLRKIFGKSMLYDGRFGSKATLSLSKDQSGKIFILSNKAKSLENAILTLNKTLEEESELSERLLQES